jgi:demethylmenaquinone methyltransferase/2-methoxy-6-polyprenyl-1,4-benzoquinol methylase
MGAMNEKPSDKTTHFGFKQVPIAEKAKHVAGVFSSVAEKYDLMNDVMSLGSHRLMKQFAVELTSARKGHTVLDLAGGTGDLTARLAPLVGDEGEVILCDINRAMLAEGRDRMLDRGLVKNIRYVQGDAEKLPFPDNHVNAITIAFGLRNVTDKDAALRSMLRVLKPGGRLVILEFSTPQNNLVRSGFDKFAGLWPKFGERLVQDADSYQYLVESIKMHPDQETLLQMMTEAGFHRCQYHNILGGVAAIHVGRKPRD